MVWLGISQAIKKLPEWMDVQNNSRIWAQNGNDRYDREGGKYVSVRIPVHFNTKAPETIWQFLGEKQCVNHHGIFNSPLLLFLFIYVIFENNFNKINSRCLIANPAKYSLLLFLKTCISRTHLVKKEQDWCFKLQRLVSQWFWIFIIFLLYISLKFHFHFKQAA